MHLRNFRSFCFRVGRKRDTLVFGFCCFTASFCFCCFFYLHIVVDTQKRGRDEKKGDVLYRPIASAEPPKKPRKCLYNTRSAFSACDCGKEGRTSTRRSGQRGCEDIVRSLTRRCQKGETSTTDLPESLVARQVDEKMRDIWSTQLMAMLFPSPLYA